MPATNADELRVIVRTEITKALKDFKNLDKGISGSMKNLDRYAMSAQRVGRSMTRYLTLPIAAAAVASVKFAADIEQQQVAFGVLLGDVERGAQLFEQLKKFSASTPLQLNDITRGSQALMAFGTAAEDVEKTMRMLGDAALGNASKLDSLVRAYGKLQAKGRASLEEINMFTENGVPLMAALAEQLGVSNENLFKMVSEGQIGFPEVQKALVSLTSEGGKFSGMMEKMSQTTSGKFSTALDNIKLSAAELGAEFLPMVNKGLDHVTALAKRFGELDEGMKKFLLTSAGITAALGPISKVAGGAMRLVGAFKKLGPLLSSLGPALLSPWGLAVAAIGAATAAVFIHRRAVLKTNREFKAAFYSDYSHILEQIEAQWIQMKEEFFAGDIDFDESTIGEFMHRINSDLEKLGSDARVTRDDIIQGLVDIAAGDEWEELRDALKITEEDILQIDDPTGYLEGVIAKLREALSGSGSGTEAMKKTWREWWSEVTGEAIEKDATPSGVELADAYLEGFNRELAAQKSVAEQLGEAFNPEDFLVEKISSLKTVLTELLGIDPDDINEPYAVADDSVRILLERLREYEGELTVIESLAEEQTDAELRRQEAIVKTLSFIRGQAEEARAAAWDELATREAALAEWDRVRTKSLAEEISGIRSRGAAFISSGADIAQVQQWVADETERVAKEFEEATGAAKSFSDALSEAADSAIEAGINAALEHTDDIFESLTRSINGSADAMNDFGSITASALEGIADAASNALIMSGDIYGVIAGVAIQAVKGIIKGSIADYDSQYNYADLIMDEEERLKKERIDSLKETIAKEKELRRKAINDLEREFDQEYAVLKDLWQRNLISTGEFESRATGLNTNLESQVAQLEEPTPAEAELTQIESAADQLEAAKTRKIANLAGLAAPLQTQLDAMSDWDKFWSLQDEGLAKELKKLDERIAAVGKATSIVEVDAARRGADFITGGPQLLMVGDNPGGRERVSVEPLSSPNIHGPGGGDTLVIQGNTFVGVGGIDELIEMLESRKRTLSSRGRLVG